MKLDSFAEFVWFGSGAVPSVLRAALAPLSRIFAMLSSLRVDCYRLGLLSSYRASVPVLSVGNLSVGGSGKTPFVIWLARRLQDRGRKVVVVSRGYGAATDDPVVLDGMQDEPALSLRRSVSDLAREAAANRAVSRVLLGESVALKDGEAVTVCKSAALAADESLLVNVRAGCPVVSFSDRVRACEVAESCFHPDLIILDDGFQHLRLRRDFDIVLLGGDEDVMRVLPAGPLRENSAALSRAHAVVFTERFHNLVKSDISESKLVLYIRKYPLALVESPRAEAPRLPLGELQGAKVLALAAIARPQAFLSMVADCGAEIVESLLFRDHHRYGLDDWQRVRDAASGVDFVVTTEKDLVKLLRFKPEPGFLRALRIDIELRGEQELLDSIDSRCSSGARSGR